MKCVEFCKCLLLYLNLHVDIHVHVGPFVVEYKIKKKIET